MARSRTFSRNRVVDRLLDLHWRQWGASGVATQGETIESWLIDPEALVVSTFALRYLDLRLASVAGQWLAQNRSWINQSRLRRVSGEFSGIDAGPDQPPLDVTVEGEVMRSLRMRPARSKRIAPVVPVQRPTLLRLRLRGLVGMDARADVLVYLLAGGAGSSRAIAAQIQQNQRGVYGVLERWVEAGIVLRLPSGYSLLHREKWLSLLGIRRLPGYLNWSVLFRILDQTALLIKSAVANDAYLLSSRLRGLAPEIAATAIQLGTAVPESAAWPGSQFAAPFIRCAEDILDRLLRRTPEPQVRRRKDAGNARGQFSGF